MGWNPLLLPLGAIAAGTVVVAVVLYGFASRLPLPFPAIMRLVCVWLVVTSTTLLVLTDETWWHAVAVGGGGLAAIVAIHLAQTRRRPAELVKEAEPQVPEEQVR